MIHDLFFIERPDWFSPTFARTFPSTFGAVAPGVDRWLANSTFVKEQLATYLEKPFAASAACRDTSHGLG